MGSLRRVDEERQDRGGQLPRRRRLPLLGGPHASSSSIPPGVVPESALRMPRGSWLHGEVSGMLRGAVLCLATLACAASVCAEARPRVCLTLSGGGARGAAHIGVLKVL